MGFVFHIVGGIEFGFDDHGRAISGDADVGSFAGFFDGGVGVFGLDLGLREHSVQELGEFVVEADFVLARHRQRQVSRG